MKKKYLLLFLLLLLNIIVKAQKASEIESKTHGFTKYQGYFTFYWDEKTGRILLEVDKFDTEFLYVNSLPAGIGSNDLGLDRGQIGQSHIVRFERTGPRILLIASNNGFRANSNDADERRAVRDAFAESTLWGFEVAAEEGGRALVDATSFYLRDAHQIPGTLQRRDR